MNLLRFLGLTKKKTEKRQINVAFEYGTHLPVLRSIVEVFHPRGVLELGAGKFSTPMFYQSVKHVVTVESDAKWIEEVAKTLPPREGFSLVHYARPGISGRTRLNALSQRQKTEAVEYYQHLLAKNPGLDFLFIDHVSGLRAFTLAQLYDRFDFIVYHDAEEKGYGYEQFPYEQSGMYFHYILQAYVPHTGFLIHKKFSARLPEFLRILERNAQAYVIEHYRFDLKDLSEPRANTACAG